MENEPTKAAAPGLTEPQWVAIQREVNGLYLRGELTRDEYDRASAAVAAERSPSELEELATLVRLAVQEPTSAIELRCCRCGDAWTGDDAPPCCMDPVSDYLAVTRERQPSGRILETVRGHDGEVIAATWTGVETLATVTA
jgi:hypothetical protein